MRAIVSDQTEKFQLFGNDLDDPNSDQLKQGDLWIGDGSILWLPVPSLSHGVVWVSSPMLLRRWAKFNNLSAKIPAEYSCSFANNNAVYLKDAIIGSNSLKQWQEWQQFVPQSSQADAINKVLVLPDNHCATLIQMSLWRQVKINLDQNKTVKNGSFRYEEAIPPDTLMYFPWGVNSAANGTAANSREIFENLITNNNILQIGGQESLGRGFVQQWMRSK